MFTTPTDDRAPDSPSHLLARIQKALKHHDDAAKRLQRTRWRFGGSLILLGPVAILLSARQSVWDIGGTRGLLLVASEAGLLLLALVVSFWQLSGSHTEWIRERLRAEILRRECFLFGARVGPYLDPERLLERVEHRLKVVGNRTKDPIELVPMATEHGKQTWHEELEATKGQPLQPLPDLASALEHYVENRVEGQRKWFAARSAQHGRYAYFFENVAKLILTAAVVLALFHFAKMAAMAGGKYDEPKWLFFWNIALPAIGAAAVGFQSLLENERLGRSYAYHLKALGRFSARLKTLQSNLNQDEAGQREIQFQFMSIVLAVEEMFSEELLQWRLLMEPSVPRAEI